MKTKWVVKLLSLFTYCPDGDRTGNVPEVIPRLLSWLAGGVVAPLPKNRSEDEEKVWSEGEPPSSWN